MRHLEYRNGKVLSALALVVALTACTAATSNDGEAAPSGSNEVSQADERPEWQIGPLDEFRVRIFGTSALRRVGTVARRSDFEEIAAETDRNQAAIEDAIVACMHEQGFVYMPRSAWLSASVLQRPPGTFIPPGTREWAERFGFGHSTQDRNGRWDEEFELALNIDQEISQQDLNRIDQMSDAEQDAFWLALEGDADFIEELRDSGSWIDPQTRAEAMRVGCRNYAHWAEVQWPDGVDEFSGIRDAVEIEFPRLVAIDPRIQQLNVEWASCMIDAGYSDWGSPLEASDYMRDEVNTATGPFDAELHINWDWENDPDGPPQVDLTALREREISIAVADWDCRNQVNYDARAAQIELELQRDFVNQHWLALEDWAGAIERGEISRLAGGTPPIFTLRRH